MNAVTRLVDEASRPGVGEEMYRLVQRLFPICRSITGKGVEETLEILSEYAALDIKRVASGTAVFDWTVPPEWNIRDAYVKDPSGRKIIDFQESNLHVISYSQAVHKMISLSELKEHVVTLPEHPDWVPYRTSYYTERWGFCASHNLMSSLAEGTYEVCIDATLADGYLCYGECTSEGETEEEVLFSTHICHPSLCNDNLSGIVVTMMLARLISKIPTRYSYRFLFIPGTIGSISWLSQNRTSADKIKHGLVVTCVGDSGPFRYKRSRRGDAEIDRVVLQVLRHRAEEYHVSDFSPYGYDERQYCSPGFNLSVGSLTRSSHGQYPEYHTSADNLSLISTSNLVKSLELYLHVILSFGIEPGLC